MEKLKLLFVAMFAALFILPLGVFAQEEEVAVEEVDNSPVTIYLFRGDGCPHCQEFEEWLTTIEGEYGSMYNVKDYETWNNQDNADLMTKVAEARNENNEELGVPYIIIGNKSWKGFTESYKEAIIEQIKEEYAKPDNERYDIMTLIGAGTDKDKEKGSSIGGDIAITILIIVIAAAAGFGLYQARKNSN